MRRGLSDGEVGILPMRTLLFSHFCSLRLVSSTRELTLNKLNPQEANFSTTFLGTNLRRLLAFPCWLLLPFWHLQTVFQ